jgi:Holliday junction DNA helicase RuvA
MIRYIKGLMLKKEDDRVVVLANGVGYEILLPTIVRQTYNQKKAGEDVVELYISFHQTTQQPKPQLIGFNFEIEREFFEKFITVKDIGPTLAAKALVLPIPKIARAIDERDVATIMRLKGIGERKAEMIISELRGKVGKFALMREDAIPIAPEPEDFRKQVEEVLVRDLGHKVGEAHQMVDEAIRRNPSISSPEELFEEVYRGRSG